jgi:glutaredoxin
VQIPGGEAAPPAYPGDGGIVLYTTRWCGACQELRRFLAARQIAFVERDVERDAAAAHEAAARAAAMGVAADRVPLVDVRGTLLVGFDPDRLTTLLGDSI